MQEQSFKEYFLTNNMPDKIAALKKGLDSKSVNNINSYLNRMLLLPDNQYSRNYKIRREFLEEITPADELKMGDEYRKELETYKKDFDLSMAGDIFYNPEVFLYHHGLRFQSAKLKDYVVGKNFIDGGAYVGDSSLVMNKFYNPKRVYSFEISPKTRENFLKVMAANNTNKYELVPMGLSDSKQTVFINDSSDLATNIDSKGDCEVKLTDLDSFVKENNINSVGFIKADLEGNMLAGLKGMAETIKRDRPVLSLAIYHTPVEFFDVKPLLDEIVKDLDYTIIVEKHHPFPDILVEMAIMAYPKELAC
jgi:FkbM family methyltransferase